MNWQQVCNHPSLQNLPFKIELDKKGKILMSPVMVYHSAYQSEISYLLRSLSKHGKALSECAIKTSLGTKVADVAWASDERFNFIRHESQCSVAPEICIEVISSGNTISENTMKRHLYFESGAMEVWGCNKKGEIFFYNDKLRLRKSKIIPDFPNKIEL